jgi:hypothetical protein
MTTDKLGKCITYSSSSASLFHTSQYIFPKLFQMILILEIDVYSAAEFVLYKLKELGKISQEEISCFLEEFDKLDVDQSGTLSTYDLTLGQTSQ